MIDRKTKLDFGIPFMWLIRFALYIRTANRAETKIALRKLGIIGLVYVGSFAWWFIGFGMSGIVFPFVVNFWITVFTGGFFSNIYSRFHFSNQSWDHLFFTNYRIPFIHVPDLPKIVASKSFRSIRKLFDNQKITLPQFPIGWSKEKGWVGYAFRRPTDPMTFFPNHVAFVGEREVDTAPMRDVFAMRAFEISPDNVVLILDSEYGGIHFGMFKDMRGFVIYREESRLDCMKAIYYLNCELRRRRDQEITRCTQIIVFADHVASAAFIGRDRRYKPVQSAIDNIAANGKMFGIHLVLFLSPDFYENAITSWNKHGFSRHNYDVAQYYSTEYVEIKSPEGKSLGFERIKSPKWGVGLFHWPYQGEKIMVQDAPPRKEQVLHRIRESVLYYPQHANDLWRKFYELYFPEFPAPDFSEQKQEEKAAAIPIQCPRCGAKAQSIWVKKADHERFILECRCRVCRLDFEEPMRNKIAAPPEREPVIVGMNGNGKSGIGDEIIHKPPNFTEDYHYK